VWEARLAASDHSDVSTLARRRQHARWRGSRRAVAAGPTPTIQPAPVPSTRCPGTRDTGHRHVMRSRAAGYLEPGGSRESPWQTPSAETSVAGGAVLRGIRPGRAGYGTLTPPNRGDGRRKPAWHPLDGHLGASAGPSVAMPGAPVGHRHIPQSGVGAPARCLLSVDGTPRRTRASTPCPRVPPGPGSADRGQRRDPPSDAPGPETRGIVMS
jgi:hypothetical protein